MSRLAIFIDGNYLMKAADRVSIDYEKLPEEILGHVDRRTAEPVDVLRTYFYDCLPWQDNDLTGDKAGEQARRFQRKASFFRRLESFPRYSVRQGVLKPRGRERGKLRFEQKRVDVLLALDLATLSFKNQIGHAALITGDNDFVPAIEVARAEGVLVWLFHQQGQNTANELVQAADERIEIDRDFLQRVGRRKLNVR